MKFNDFLHTAVIIRDMEEPCLVVDGSKLIGTLSLSNVGTGVYTAEFVPTKVTAAYFVGPERSISECAWVADVGQVTITADPANLHGSGYFVLQVGENNAIVPPELRNLAELLFHVFADDDCPSEGRKGKSKDLKGTEEADKPTETVKAKKVPVKGEDKPKVTEPDRTWSRRAHLFPTHSNEGVQLDNSIYTAWETYRKSNPARIAGFVNKLRADGCYLSEEFVRAAISRARVVQQSRSNTGKPLIQGPRRWKEAVARIQSQVGIKL